MKDQIYIVVDASGAQRMTKRAPSLYRNEVAVRIKITVPDQCFRSLEVAAEIEVQEEQVIQPAVTVTALDAPPPPAEVSVDGSSPQIPQGAKP